MVNGLLNHLKAETDIPFVYMAWSHSEERLYGVVTLSDQSELDTDFTAVSEKMLEGYVDVFTKNPDGAEITQVESCLRRMGIWFTMNSTQYEDDTGYIHYEWLWRDTNGTASEKIGLVRFDLGGQITESWEHYGAVPTPPTFVPVYDNPTGVSNGGCWIVLAGWNPSIVPVNGNADYTAEIHVAVKLVGIKIRNCDENSPITNGYPSLTTPFTQEAYDLMVAAFNAGIPITDHQTNGVLLYTVKSIDGYTAVLVDPVGTEFTFEIEVQ